MNAVAQEVLSQHVAGVRRQVVGAWDLDGWPAATEPTTIPSSWPNRSSGHLHASVGSVFGEGRCYSTTQLAVLDFMGERLEDAEDADEIVFTAAGTIRAYGIADRNVFVKGRAKRTFRSERTPFLEGFHGHAVVSDDTYTWSVNSTNLFQVTGVAAAPARRARYQPPSRAYNSFTELSEWLEMSIEELGAIVGVSRGTISTSWKNGNEPRKRAGARRLFQLHGLVAALHGVLGDDLTVWLRRGSPCPLKLLENGRIDRFERVADAVIFPPSESPRARLDAAWPPSTVTPSDASQPGRMKRATRARSRRLEP